MMRVVCCCLSTFISIAVLSSPTMAAECAQLKEGQTIFMDGVKYSGRAPRLGVESEICLREGRVVVKNMRRETFETFQWTPSQIRSEIAFFMGNEPYAVPGAAAGLVSLGVSLAVVISWVLRKKRHQSEAINIKESGL
jgi:hypothetical protein